MSVKDTGPGIPEEEIAIAQGPGYTGGWLTSTSTSRPGYVQVVDLAPTALAALGRPIPGKLFAGGVATMSDGKRLTGNYSQQLEQVTTAVGGHRFVSV